MTTRQVIVIFRLDSSAAEGNNRFWTNYFIHNTDKDDFRDSSLAPIPPTFWDSDEPNGYVESPREACVVMRTESRKAVDKRCDATHGVLCQKMCMSALFLLCFCRLYRKGYVACTVYYVVAVGLCLLQTGCKLRYTKTDGDSDK